MNKKPRGNLVMTSPTLYLHAGFILISVANLIVIGLLIVIFMFAVTLRRPEKSHLSTLATPTDANKMLAEDSEKHP
jgi:hypothetical protein